MIKAYKYRIYPNEDQKIFFAKNFGCARFIYNYGLGLMKKQYEENKDKPKEEKPRRLTGMGIFLI